MLQGSAQTVDTIVFISNSLESNQTSHFILLKNCCRRHFFSGYYTGRSFLTLLSRIPGSTPGIQKIHKNYIQSVVILQVSLQQRSVIFLALVIQTKLWNSGELKNTQKNKMHCLLTTVLNSQTMVFSKYHRILDSFYVNNLHSLA